MKPARRVRVTVTLPADLVAEIDRYATETQSDSRSSAMERWLRAGARRHAERAIEEATIAYYKNLAGEDLEDAEALSHALSAASQKLDIDGPGPRRERAKTPARSLARKRA